MATGQDRTAVVIEDDADVRNLLSAILNEAGFHCVPAATGVEGINAVREHQPILTTLDVSLPGIDGFEVARRIRSFSNTYVIMLSARDEEKRTGRSLPDSLWPAAKTSPLAPSSSIHWQLLSPMRYRSAASPIQ